MKNGFIILDKPSGVASRAAGARAAKIFGTKKFGHMGTLDPMASGLLVIALGEATKMIPYVGIRNSEFGNRDSETRIRDSDDVIRIVRNTRTIPTNSGFRIPNSDKEYLFSIKWGVKTDTDDITGKVLEEGGRIPSDDEILAVLPEMLGEYEQMPPAFSAKKVGGVAAYKLARQGRAVELVPKRVRIFELEQVEFPSGGGVACSAGVVRHACTTTPPASQAPLHRRGTFTPPPTTNPDFRIPNSESRLYRVRCGEGTYVRALVRDIAARLGAIATASVIRRTASNGFDIKDAVKLDFLENMYNNAGAEIAAGYVRGLDFGLDGIPVSSLGAEDLRLFQNGGGVVEKDGREGPRRVYSDNRFVGIGIVRGGVLLPKRVIKNRKD